MPFLRHLVCDEKIRVHEVSNKLTSCHVLNVKKEADKDTTGNAHALTLLIVKVEFKTFSSFMKLFYSFRNN